MTDHRPAAVANDVGRSERRPRPRTQASGDVRQQDTQADDDARLPAGSWWTEAQADRYERGDQVRAIRATGGDFLTHVPEGTEGRVVGTRLGVLGGEYATVEFDNGYTEEIQTSDIERRSWWG